LGLVQILAVQREKKKLFVIIGSAGNNSANEKLVECFAELTSEDFELAIYTDLKKLPHFDPELSTRNTPDIILAFRDAIEKADGILISSPEYIFSIPSGLKNAIEWCVSTTVFSGKPVGIITASADGRKGHEEIQLIMKTLMANFNEATTLLIQGIKGKINEQGKINDYGTMNELGKFAIAFTALVRNGTL
jgi:NAD(P)H-dependent FMN reductase